MKLFYTFMLLFTVAFAQDTVIWVGTAANDNMTVPVGTDVAIFYPQGGRDLINTNNCEKCIIYAPVDGELMTTPLLMDGESLCSDARFHQVTRMNWNKTFIAMDRVDSLYGFTNYADIQHYLGTTSEYVRVAGDSCYSLTGLRILSLFNVGTFDPSFNIIRVEGQSTFNIVLEDEEEETDTTVHFEQPFTQEYFDLAGRQVWDIRSDTFSGNTLAVRVVDAKGRFVRSYLWFRYR